ncbi:15198_t:CDS:2, partial [Racocetra persica]
ASELLKTEDCFPPETVRGKVAKWTRSADMVELAFKEVSVKRLPHDMRDNIHAQMTILKQRYEEAADGNMKEAQLRYGNCLFKEEGTPKDLAKAAEYFKKAVDNGNPTAMYNIRNIYCHGYGVKRDLVEGKRFLKLAAYRQQPLATKMCKQK